MSLLLKMMTIISSGKCVDESLKDILVDTKNKSLYISRDEKHLN
jgi:hypothetical protein